jgi:hypothetical protein
MYPEDRRASLEPSIHAAERAVLDMIRSREIAAKIAKNTNMVLFEQETPEKKEMLLHQLEEAMQETMNHMEKVREMDIALTKSVKFNIGKTKPRKRDLETGSTTTTTLTSRVDGIIESPSGDDHHDTVHRWVESSTSTGASG